jgi:hypothetical protein
MPGLRDQDEGAIGRQGQRGNANRIGQHALRERAEMTLPIREQGLPRIEFVARVPVRDPQRAQVVRALEVEETRYMQPDRAPGAAPGWQRVAPHPDHVAVEDQAPMVAYRQHVSRAGLERAGQAVGLPGQFADQPSLRQLSLRQPGPGQPLVGRVADQGRAAAWDLQVNRVGVGRRGRDRVHGKRGGGGGELVVGPSKAELARVTHEFPPGPRPRTRPATR